MLQVTALCNKQRHGVVTESLCLSDAKLWQRQSKAPKLKGITEEVIALFKGLFLYNGVDIVQLLSIIRL